MLTPDPELAVAYGLFSIQQARDAGIGRAELERGLRNGRWERAARGILVTAGRAARPGDDLVLASLKAGPGAVVGFESAAQVHGWDLLHEPKVPRLIVGPDGHGGYRTALEDSEVMLAGPVVISTPVRTALDISCDVAGEDAVVAIDSAMRSKTVSISELSEAFDASLRRGIRKGRSVLSQCDPLSGSVPETQARLLFARAGLPAPVSQLGVLIDGKRMVRVDFGWLEQMVLVEIDGFGPHTTATAFQSDRTRQNGLAYADWLILRFTVWDIRFNPEYVVFQVRRALDRPRWAL